MTRLMRVFCLTVCAVSCSTAAPVTSPEPPPDRLALNLEGVAEVSADADWVALVDLQGSIRVLDRWGRTRCQPKESGLGAAGVADALLRFVSADGRLLTYDIQSCRLQSETSAPNAIESVVRWAPSGRYFIARQGLSKVVYSSDGQLAGVVESAGPSVFSAIGDRLVWIDQDGCAQLWDIGGEIQNLECSALWVGTSGNRAVVATATQVRVWDLTERLATCPRMGKPLYAQDGRLVEVSDGQLVTRSLVTCAARGAQPANKVTSVEFAGDGQWLLIQGDKAVIGPL